MKRREFIKTAMAATAAIGLSNCAKTKKRPNILFAIADDASYPHMSAYGCKWVNTPAFDYVAKNGVLFSKAYTPNAKCAPSRSCILTGRNSWQLEEACNHVPYFPAKFKTYAETLLENGYWVGHTAKGWAPGNPGQVNGKRRELCGPSFNQHQTEPPAQYISKNNYTENFKDFLDQKPADQPFCFWYGSTEPHRAYEFGAGIKKGKKKLKQIDRVFDFWPDTDTVRTDMLDYAFEIEYFDQHLQRMLDELEERGELDNTLVVVTADNGMPFPRIKGQEYEYSNHLPMAAMWADGIKNPGRVVDDFVNFVDLAPTFLEIAQVSQEASGMHPIAGKSLTDIFSSRKKGIVNPQRDHVLIAKERHDVGRPQDWGYPIRGIFKDNYLYLKNFETERWPAGRPETGYLDTDGSPTKTVCLDARDNTETFKYWSLNFGKRPAEELYDIAKDPDCMNNLSDSIELLDFKKSLKKQMIAELTAQEDPRILGNGEIFDNYPYSEPDKQNFYEKLMNGELEKSDAGWVNESDFRKKIE